jgi:hypothetical protein
MTDTGHELCRIGRSDRAREEVGQRTRVLGKSRTMSGLELRVRAVAVV